MFEVEELKKALEDKEFAEAYDKAQTIEEAVAVLNGKGLEVTKEELETVIKAISTFAANNGELDDDALENVAGGVTLNLTNVTKWYNDPGLLFNRPFVTELKK